MGDLRRRLSRVVQTAVAEPILASVVIPSQVVPVMYGAEYGAANGASGATLGSDGSAAAAAAPARAVSESGSAPLG